MTQSTTALIDLHTHTTASDGSCRPAEVVAAAKAAGLAAVAITDHDTTAGLDEALAAGRELGLEVIPGVEISVNGGPTGSMHVLGLFVDHHRPDFAQAMERLQEARAQRNPQIAQKLQEMGVAVTMDMVRAHAGGGLVGRAHFAQAMVELGAVANRQEAFGRYLARGKPAYVEKYRLECDQAMALLRAAGGVPVLAHPGLLKQPPTALEALLRQLASMGLEGLEAHYSEHDELLTKRLQAMAGKLGLIVTGGSDFHGAAKPDIRLGTGLGLLRTPASLLEPLRRRRDRIRALAAQ
ncbi:PHP domain protein [Desulfarculus baarsii DSM 2075]|uniref:PHP domain protein n=1 Tax=Desulfarculus baarsii (strain ATCC 33931 / DSM 2075 / LMG 7858 / VKM B-1802 / 2st14) TaxID=644282 RepID=E1QEI7_DESB2|nr:PHP domain-containing protein [Desulfarculus baarsii]ADK83973.1 PHP domain protein [Desulfarculus baarsii DSM 2075]